MKRKIAGIFLLVLFAHSFALSEIKDVGTPFIRNFSKHDYKAGTQNWAVAQDQKGFMYFANNEGLLVFDGVNWELYKMPNSSMVRSIFINDKGEIYIGAYNEFGKMVPGSDGKLAFISLRSKIPSEYQNFDDVWSISPYRGKIVFQSYNAIYIYEEGKPISVVKVPLRVPVSFSVSGRLIINDLSEGLMELSGTDLIQLKGCERLKGEDISSVLPYDGNNELLICTIHRGLFLYDGTNLKEWDIPVNELLKKYQIISASTLQDRYYALGTIQDGVIIIDNKGTLIQHINDKKGLQNNTILKVFSDRAGNLWLGLDNGIDYVIANSPVTFLQNPDGFGAGYAELIYKGKLYLGTNQGLYVTDWQNEKTSGNYKMIPGTYGQVWYLGVHNGVLVCGHNYGTFIIDGEKATLINNIPGGWKYHILKRYPGYLLGGTFSGLILFKWENGTWKFLRRIPGFNESFRVFEEDDNGDLWMSHGFKGVYRVRLNDKLDSVAESRYYTKKDGLPSNYTLNVFKVKDKIIFTSDSAGIYEYAPQNDRFQYSVYFNQLVKPLVGITYLKEDPDKNIWYVSNNKIGVFRIQEDFSFKQVTSSFILLAGKFIHGFESIYTYSDDQIFIGIENGFAHYSPHAYFKSYPDFSTYIVKAVAVNLDSAFYYGYGNSSAQSRFQAYSFPFKDNNFRFLFSSPVYDNPGNIEYSYKLSGYNENWSRWSSTSFHEFSHLPEGKYVFVVKARNQLELESLSDSLEFTVLPPWYKSVIAYVIYALIFISSVFLLIWTVNKKIEISNRKERLKQLREYREKEREYIRQALLSEKKIISMKNERLQIEMKQQDKELANQAMNIVRKNEFLARIKEELVNLKKDSREENINEKIVSVISRINREVGHNKQREVFEKAFDEVHEAFLNRLKSKYPFLTPTELRLCAFLKMNISTKEIAPLMNISVRGVEICRYRIRKKLGIDRTTNLTSLLINI
jgi:ligand-binding sensor domain-containing protein/DNA-binding CsgD family transcriptional regulator